MNVPGIVTIEEPSVKPNRYTGIEVGMPVVKLKTAEVALLSVEKLDSGLPDDG